MEKDVSSSHNRYMQGVQLSKIAPGVHRVLTETSDLYRSKSVSGLPLKSEVTSLIEKTLQEVGKKSCPSEKELFAKRLIWGREDKEGDCAQEEYGIRLSMAEQWVRKHEFKKHKTVFLIVLLSLTNCPLSF
uniref:Uncharacterized protein n=1 Tax=Chelonoidis abingdonii TaxID=106734 RepID=A0A8C0H8M2_CHEAB